MRKPLATIAAVLVMVSVVFAVTGDAGVARAAAQGPMQRAYRLLRRSQYVLKHACKRLGGHREQALAQIDAAITEVQAAVAAQNGSLPTVAESGAITASGETHPYIHDALRKCNQAKAQLAAVTKADAGGHRAAAIQHLNSAISALQQALTEPACGG